MEVRVGGHIALTFFLNLETSSDKPTRLQVCFELLALPDLHPTSTRSYYLVGTRRLPGRILALLSGHQIVIPSPKHYTSSA